MRWLIDIGGYLLFMWIIVSALASLLPWGLIKVVAIILFICWIASLFDKDRA